MREVKETQRTRQEQADETTAELLMVMQQQREEMDEALAEMMLLYAGKEGE